MGVLSKILFACFRAFATFARYHIQLRVVYTVYNIYIVQYEYIFVVVFSGSCGWYSGARKYDNVVRAVSLVLSF